MAHFEIDLPTAKAGRFDRCVDRFVLAELICRPDIDIRVTSFAKEPGIEHRQVYLSSEAHLHELRSRWAVVDG